MRVPAQPDRLVLREPFALRRQQDHDIRYPTPGPDRLHRTHQRFGFHDHPRTAPVGHVINAAVPVRRVLAEVVHLHVENTRRDTVAHHAFRKRRVNHPRKDRDDVELHLCAAKGGAAVRPIPYASRLSTCVPPSGGADSKPLASFAGPRSFNASNPSGGSIRMRFASTSISTQISTASGIRISPRGPFITSRVAPAPPSTAATVPTTAPATVSTAQPTSWCS